jgi:hypothetical protein
MPERNNIKINCYTSIAERISESLTGTLSGGGNTKPFQNGMAFYQNENHRVDFNENS